MTHGKNPEENSEDNSRDNPADNSRDNPADNPEDSSRNNPKDNSEEVFREKAPEGHLYALDVDPIEIVKTGERLQKAGYGEEILTILQQNFANLETVAKEYGPFDFMLADLGVSSMQIDDPKRGFSYKADGLLDLRLDPQHGIPASQRLRELNREELIGMLVEKIPMNPMRSRLHPRSAKHSKREEAWIPQRHYVRLLNVHCVFRE